MAKYGESMPYKDILSASDGGLVDVARLLMRSIKRQMNQDNRRPTKWYLSVQAEAEDGGQSPAIMLDK